MLDILIDVVEYTLPVYHKTSCLWTFSGLTDIHVALGNRSFIVMHWQILTMLRVNCLRCWQNVLLNFFIVKWMEFFVIELLVMVLFLVLDGKRTSGPGVTSAKKQCRLDIRKFSFSQRTVNEWNRLSADCVGASSVNIFKIKSTYT